MSEDPASHEHLVTPFGRSARSLLWRRWPAFAVEFVLIIVGILTALAIDGWVQDRRDRRTETAYLELLRDDLVEIESQLATLAARRTVQISSAAYTDLQSTSNLKIISNRELRQRIVHYFAQTERAELVVEKNHSAFVDRLFAAFLLEAGITIGLRDSHEPVIAEGNRRLLLAGRTFAGTFYSGPESLRSVRRSENAP